MPATLGAGARISIALAVLLIVLTLASLAVGPAALTPRAVVKALVDGEGIAGVIVREIRLPRTLLALAIGATFGLAGAALQGLLRNPLAEPALFGAPQAAAAGASLVIAFGLAPATSLAVPFAGIAGALASIGGLVAIAGRRASLTVTLLAGLALASFAGAATALILNLAPNPYIALEIAFWLLGSLEDRSREHVALVLPFLLASWILVVPQARAFRALTLGEDAAASLGVDLARTRLAVVTGVALGVGASVAVTGSIGQWAITEAFKLGEASVIAPLEYTSLVWGVALDWMLWSWQTALPQRSITAKQVVSSCRSGGAATWTWPST